MLTRFRSPQAESKSRRVRVAPKPANDAHENPKPIASAKRAATQLSSARNLEEFGQLSAALKFYRDLVKTYPDTPQAKIAAQRIRLLEKKLAP